MLPLPQRDETDAHHPITPSFIEKSSKCLQNAYNVYKMLTYVYKMLTYVYKMLTYVYKMLTFRFTYRFTC